MIHFLDIKQCLGIVDNDTVCFSVNDVADTINVQKKNIKKDIKRERVGDGQEKSTLMMMINKGKTKLRSQL